MKSKTINSQNIYYLNKDGISKHVDKFTDEQIQEYLDQGWKIGKSKKHWITNNIENRLLDENEPMPEGFYFGQSEEYRAKNSAGGRRRWANASSEDRRKLSEAVSNGLRKTWALLPEEKKQQREAKRRKTRENWSDEYRQEVHEILSEAAKANRKTISSEEYHRRSVLGTQTKKINGTFVTSSFENICYDKLCETYGADDIEQEYMDKERYPFKCDFYIKSRDLFIELNIHPSHGTHPFNSSDPSDMNCAEKLKLENSAWANIILSVWCGRDVKKIECAKKHELNYLTIYKDDFDNFINMLEEKML